MSRDTGVFFLFRLFFITLILFLGPLNTFKTAVEMVMAATAVTVSGAQDATCLKPLVSFFFVIFFFFLLY